MTSYDETPGFNTVVNPTGVNFEYVPALADKSELRCALVWPSATGAAKYSVRLNLVTKSACYPDPLDGHEFIVEGLLGPPPNRFEIPSPQWEAMEAAKWTATITPLNAYDEPFGAPVTEHTFMKCTLGDLDPFDTEGKLPVVLVHGWNSNSSTWYYEDQSPLKDALVAGDGPAESKRHPWAFEYPNTGSIQESAAGLGDALRYIEHVSDTSEVQVVAHSMGGLVTRAYLEDLAVQPGSGELYPDYRGDVTRVVTLSSPHLGEPYTLEASYLKRMFVDCNGVAGSPSAYQLNEGKEFIRELARKPLPGTTGYMFAAGTDYFGYSWTELPQYNALTAMCPYGNDAVVDVCSARGGDCEGDHESGQINPGTASITRRNYLLSHNRMSQPGAQWPVVLGVSNRNSASERLLDHVTTFLRYGEVDPQGCPSGPMINFLLKLQATRRFLHFPLGMRDSINGLAAQDDSLDLVGAKIRFETNTNPPEYFTVMADETGEVACQLPLGSYRMRIEAPGYTERVETIPSLDAGASVLWTLNLDEDDAHQGPTAPRLVINAGALCTSDSVVTLQLGCEGATEYSLTDSADFEAAEWNSLVATRTWQFSGAEGVKVLEAKYRDALGRETAPQAASIILRASTEGALTISSDPDSALVIVNGRNTGKTTPTTLADLGPAFYRVELKKIGVIWSTSMQVVEVDSGEVISVSFSGVGSPPPIPVDLNTLSSSEYFSAKPLRWMSVAAGESTAVLYNASLSTDTTEAGEVWSKLGIPDTTVFIDAVPDSSRYYVSVVSVNETGLPQAGPALTRAMYLDRTAPLVHIDSPSGGDTLLAGESYTLRANVLDWGPVDRSRVLISFDGGSSWPDTLYEGDWVDSLSLTAPLGVNSGAVRLRVEATDAAGNLGSASMDSSLLVFDSVTGVEGQSDQRVLAFTIQGNPVVDERVTFTYSLPSAAELQIVAFDVQGRIVRRLVDAPKPPGKYTTSWDRRDDNGRRVSSGIYFIRLSAGREELVRRAVLLR